MKRFNYKAKDKNGKVVIGEVEASNEQAAAKLIRSKDLIVISLKPKREFGLNLIKKLKIDNIVTVNTIINRNDALREMKDCDFLLFHGDVGSSSVVSTKLLEYIFMETPILGICKSNEAEHVIEKTCTGIVTGFEVDEIIDGLKKAFQGIRTFHPCF